MSHSPNAVMLSCRDCAASVAFYRDVLGFELEQSWPDEAAPQWANLLMDGQSIMLGQNPSEEEAASCGHGPEDRLAFWRDNARAFHAADRPGVGVAFYIRVPDVDAYHAALVERGTTPLLGPMNQFYGLRDIVVADPDGYQLVFYTPIKMSECQSCGMPLADAQPGQMYCGHCTDDAGNLHPYEAILEGTIQGYFMGMRGMERAEAETAAKEHLAKMPAWVGR